MKDLFDLTGKVALVTGSTEGIGKAIAVEMARHGARVVIASRTEAAVHAVAKELNAAGGEALGCPCDVSDRAQVEHLADFALEKCGRVDILVSNAATSQPYAPSTQWQDSDWDRIMDTNARSSAWLAQKLLPQMAARKDGSAIFVSTLSTMRGSAKAGLYAISKSALEALSRALAVEWGPHNVRVNCIVPGLVSRSPGREHLVLSNPENLAQRLSITPLGRGAEPREIAGIAVFLASRAASYITGQKIVADGGASIGWGSR